MSFEIERAENTTTIYRITPQHRSVVCQVIDTSDGRLLLIELAKKPNYRFTPVVKFKKAGSYCVAKFDGAISIFAKPNAAQFHNELMLQNRRRYYLGQKAYKDKDDDKFSYHGKPLELEVDRLIDNMLVSVATV